MSAKTNSIPPSFLRRFTFDEGDVQALAKHAVYRDGDPARLWTFCAHEVQVGDVEVNPPYTFDDDHDLSTMRAFYTGHETSTIVYFLETWHDEAGDYFEENYLVWELHELTHWAMIDDEENETGPGHWERWNEALTDVALYAMESDGTNGYKEETA